MKRSLSLSDIELENVFSQSLESSSPVTGAGSAGADLKQGLKQDLDQKLVRNATKLPQNVCNYSPCSGKVFETFNDYSLHVISTHTYVCSQCQKVFFNDRLLEIHIEENHSSFFAQQRDRGDKVYLCFEPLCIKKFANRTKRRQHLIDKHQYPESYRFNIVDTGTNNIRSLLR